MKRFLHYFTAIVMVAFSYRAYAEDFNSVYKKGLSKFEQKEYIQSLHLFQKAYSIGDNTLSPMRIGEIYICGYGVEPNEKEGVKWIKIAADNNNSEAQATIGRYYNHTGDDKNAFEYFLKAAQNGDINGKYWLGQAYLYGKGTIQDSKKALRWTLSAAQCGNPGAQWELARAYFEGHTNPFDLDCNADEFIIWTKKAADNGFAMAQYYMGMIYLDGFNNTPIDKSTAKRWIQKAADQQLPEAINTLKERF